LFDQHRSRPVIVAEVGHIQRFERSGKLIAHDLLIGHRQSQKRFLVDRQDAHHIAERQIHHMFDLGVPLKGNRTAGSDRHGFQQAGL